MNVHVTRVPVSAQASARLSGQDLRLFGMPLSLQKREGAETDLTAEWAAVRSSWAGKTKDQLRDHPVAKAYLSFYASLGINANKTPPSAMNLVTRFAIASGAGKSVPRIHPAVDAGNLVQAETLLPVAVFDAEGIDGDLLLDTPRADDVFLGFGFTQPEPVQADRLVLRDASKVISELCYRDGQTTAVKPATSRLYVVIPVVPGVENGKAVEAMERVAAVLGRSYEIECRR